MDDFFLTGKQKTGIDNISEAGTCLDIYLIKNRDEFP
jgi:hypothetical protein